VGCDRICELLWPDLDSDASYQAYSITLYRLRQLLGTDTLVRLDRSIHLDKKRCWVDAWHFKDKLEKRYHAQDVSWCVVVGCTAIGASLYGSFFCGKPWILSFTVA